MWLIIQIALGVVLGGVLLVFVVGVLAKLEEAQKTKRAAEVRKAAEELTQRVFTAKKGGVQ